MGAPAGRGTGPRATTDPGLFLSSLAAEELLRLEIEDGQVVHQEVLFKGIGRVFPQE